jgi:carbamoyltransferase
MHKNYIGIVCTGHDASISIVNAKGEILFAEAAERYLQNKRAILSPPVDIVRIHDIATSYCDPEAEVIIAKSWGNVKTIQQLIESFESKINEDGGLNPQWILPFQILLNFFDIVKYSILNGEKSLLDYFLRQGKSVEVRSYDHHLSHAASSAYTSPFDEAVCASIDGFGEGAAINFFHYYRGKFIPLKEKNSDVEIASLGYFYALTLCRLCGFSGLKGEEWKIMGLAAYGRFNGDIYDIFQKILTVDGLRLYHPNEAKKAYGELIKYGRKPGTPAESVADFAYTGQFFFSEIMTQLLENLYRMELSENLVLGGGCALNSAYIGQITKSTRFKHVHVNSAPADDGTALGAALLAFYEDNPDSKKDNSFVTPYLGSKMSSKTLDNLHRFGKIKGLRILEYETIYSETAKLLAEGKIIGWIQGRAEFGPRALGNRSILADPRRPDMKDKINGSVKFREEFRPFAPSILHEFGDEYFIDYQESPYMERTLRFSPDVHHQVPAVVHKDGTGRVQTVKKEWNEKYHALISEFHRLTGIPILLNTSFNIMGKPIIHSVEDAIAVFHTTGLDALVINNFLIAKSKS